MEERGRGLGPGRGARPPRLSSNRLVPGSDSECQNGLLATSFASKDVASRGASAPSGYHATARVLGQPPLLSWRARPRSGRAGSVSVLVATISKNLKNRKKKEK